MSVHILLDQHPSNIFARYAYRGRRFRPTRHRFLPRLTGTDRETVVGVLVAVVAAGALTLLTAVWS